MSYGAQLSRSPEDAVNRSGRCVSHADSVPGVAPSNFNEWSRLKSGAGAVSMRFIINEGVKRSQLHIHSSKQNRRQECPGRRLIKPSAHQSQRLNDPKAIAETPAEQLVVA